MIEEPIIKSMIFKGGSDIEFILKFKGPQKTVMKMMEILKGDEIIVHSIGVCVKGKKD